MCIDCLLLCVDQEPFMEMEVDLEIGVHNTSLKCSSVRFGKFALGDQNMGMRLVCCERYKVYIFSNIWEFSMPALGNWKTEVGLECCKRYKLDFQGI